MIEHQFMLMCLPNERTNECKLEWESLKQWIIMVFYIDVHELDCAPTARTEYFV